SIELARTRSVSPLLLLVEAMGAGISGLLLVAAAGKLGHPLLQRIRAHQGGIGSLALPARDELLALARVSGQLRQSARQALQSRAAGARPARTAAATRRGRKIARRRVVDER